MEDIRGCAKGSFCCKHSNKNQGGFITERDMALAQFGFMGYIALTSVS